MGTEKKEVEKENQVKRNYQPAYTLNYPSDVPDMQIQGKKMSFWEKCKSEPFITLAIATGTLMLANAIRLYPKRKFHHRVPMDYVIAWRVYWQGSIVGIITLAAIHSRYTRWKDSNTTPSYNPPLQIKDKESPV